MTHRQVIKCAWLYYVHAQIYTGLQWKSPKINQLTLNYYELLGPPRCHQDGWCWGTHQIRIHAWTASWGHRQSTARIPLQGCKCTRQRAIQKGRVCIVRWHFSWYCSVIHGYLLNIHLNNNPSWIRFIFLMSMRGASQPILMLDCVWPSISIDRCANLWHEL